MDPIMIEVDTSEDTPPRGFPEFDKLQLDPVKREFMKKMRIEMLDFNEEYLAKHPQVEAILRLITIEVLSHKPHDVRKFIKELLLSDNLETRVAKVVLSKRLNLEESHVREYFQHVAEWEAKAKADDDLPSASYEWPEPRPKRKESRRSKPGYSHLHYFKRPYWIYPKEFMRANAEDGNEKKLNILKLPNWKSGFLLNEYFIKWRDAFEMLTEKKDLKKTNVRRKCLSKRARKMREILARTTPDDVAEVTTTDNDNEWFGAEKNRELVLKCPSCRKAVAGLDRCIDGSSVARSLYTLESGKTSMLRSSRMLMGETVIELEKELADADRLRVVRRPGAEGVELVTETGERLEEVSARLPELLLWMKTAVDCHPRWGIKRTGQEIKYVVPASEINQKLIEFGDSGLPAKYGDPVFQILMPAEGHEHNRESEKSYESFRADSCCMYSTYASKLSSTYASIIERFRL